jgi:hypothetical protein
MDEEDRLARELSALSKTTFDRARKLEEAARVLNPDLIGEPLPATEAAVQELQHQLGEAQRHSTHLATENGWLKKRVAELEAGGENAAGSGVPEAGVAVALNGFDSVNALREAHDGWESLAAQRLSELAESERRVEALREKLSDVRKERDSLRIAVADYESGAIVEERDKFRDEALSLRDRVAELEELLDHITKPPEPTPPSEDKPLEAREEQDDDGNLRVGVGKPERVTPERVRDAVVAKFNDGKRFSSAAVAEEMGVGETSVRTALRRLTEMEHPIIEKIGTVGRGAGFRYIKPQEAVKKPVSSKPRGEPKVEGVGSERTTTRPPRSASRPKGWSDKPNPGKQDGRKVRRQKKGT